MITIALTGAEFFAHHGFYPEEQLLGNKFIVDIEVSFISKGNFKDDSITNTIDYEKLYNIAGAAMLQTSKLIETVAFSIADRIKEKYPFVEKVKVSVKKLNPPFKSRVEYSSIVVIL